MIRATALPASSRKKSLPARPLWWVKLTNYEYWPFYILFLPSILYGLYLALKSRSITYFTAANPGIELGGFFGESKIGILNKINKKYLPVTHFYASTPAAEQVMTNMKSSGIDFPVICKPDKGERGFKVEKINNTDHLKKYLSGFTGELIVQEFIDYEFELGVLYYRFPDGSKSGITSIVKKEFLSVTGDGVQTIGELIDNSERARFQKDRLKKELRLQYDAVLPSGEKFILDKIGNHCRGTTFLNGNDLINNDLVAIFDKIATPMEGVYFGRFDLKVKTMNDLYDGANIKIMEFNGTTSEPAHIYDPELSLLQAQKSILYNTRLVYEIAKQNHTNGFVYTPFREALKLVTGHIKSRSVNVG